MSYVSIVAANIIGTVFRDQRLIYLAKSLAPAYLRLGGTDADLIDFVPHLSPSKKVTVLQGGMYREMWWGIKR